MSFKLTVKGVLQEVELIRSSGLVFFSNFMGSIFLFISNLFLSRHFGPEIFGNYKTIVNLFLFLPSLIEFGVGTALTKHIAEFGEDKGRISKLIKWFLKFRFIIYLVLLVTIFVLKDQMAFYFLKNVSLNYLFLAGLLLTGMVFFEVFKSIILGFQNFKLYSYSQFLTLTSAGLFTIILGYYFGVFYAIIGWALSYLVGNLPVIWFVINRRVLSGGIGLNVKKIFFSYSLPIYLMIIPEFLGAGMIPILSLFFSQKLIGYYSFAWIFYMGVLLIPSALSSVLFPKFSELNGKNNLKRAKSILNKVFIIYTPIVIVGIIGSLLFSSFVVKVIAPDYLPGLLVFKTLICFGLLAGYLLVYRSYLSGLAEFKKLTLTVIVQNVVLLIVSFIVMISL